MSFTLLDQAPEGAEFSATVWKWRAVLEIIKSLDVFSENMVRKMGYNATGSKVDVDDAHLIGEKIRDVILPKLSPNKRMYADLSITNAHDDGTLYSEPDEEWKNYSVSHDWLKDFSDFCLASKGFQIF